MAEEATTIRDFLADSVRQYGDQVAFISPHEGRSLTYKELDARTNQLANALLSEFQVGRQQPVGIMSQNSHRSIELYFACAKIGAINSSIGHMMMAPEIPPVVNGIAPTVLFHGPAVADKVAAVREQLTSVRHTVEFGDAYEALLARHSAELPAPPAVLPDDGFATFLTSGTTGNPKAVVRSHRSLVSIKYPITRPDVMVLYNDYAWIGATIASMLVFRSGGTVVSMPRYDRDAYHRLIVEHRPTTLFLLPAPFRDLLDAPADVVDTLNACQTMIGYGGGKIPAPLIARLKAKLPALPFMQGYGQTESGSISVLRPDHHKAEPSARDMEILGSAGLPAPDADVIIVDPDTDERRGVNQPGEILVKSAANMTGYFNNPEATRRAFCGDYLRTGDVGYLDDEGFLHICSRVKDMIVLAAGINVFPAELEAAVESLFPADVHDVSVVGVPHPTDVGEKVVMYVVRKPDSALTADAIEQALAARLAPFKQPHLIIFTDALPYNANGKCLKRELVNLPSHLLQSLFSS